MNEAATRAADFRTPPRVANGTAPNAFGIITATALSGAAVSVDLGIQKGGAYFSFQANGAAQYVRFGASATTATSASNGYQIPADTTAEFWISAADRYVDVFGASGTLRWWQSSPNFDNR